MKSGEQEGMIPEADASLQIGAAEPVEEPVIEGTQAEEPLGGPVDDVLAAAEGVTSGSDSPDDPVVSGAEPDAQPEADVQPETEAIAEAEAGLGADVEAEVEPEAEPAADLEGDVKPEAEATAESESDGREWYVVHSYSGYENKVKKNLEHRIESLEMQHKIFQVVVPTEEEIELRDGQRRTVQRRIFPGYILVEMIMDKDSWYVVRNTPGVTGFVGSGSEPTPLPQRDVDRILGRMEAEAPRIKVTFKRGQKVRINDGPFEDFVGMVDEIYADKGKLRILVSFFGRETPVELDFLQVDRI